ncbi:hypothetical protein DFQ29_008537, partial [Apophysomyces sp. BC1021]
IEKHVKRHNVPNLSLLVQENSELIVALSKRYADWTGLAACWTKAFSDEFMHEGGPKIVVDTTCPQSIWEDIWNSIETKNSHDSSSMKLLGKAAKRNERRLGQVYKLESVATSSNHKGRQEKRRRPNCNAEPSSPTERYQQGEAHQGNMWRAAGMRTPPSDPDFDNSNPFNDDPPPIVLHLPRKNGVDIGPPPRPEYSWKLGEKEVSTFFQYYKHRALHISTIETGLQIESQLHEIMSLSHILMLKPAQYGWLAREVFGDDLLRTMYDQVMLQFDPEPTVFSSAISSAIARITADLSMSLTPSGSLENAKKRKIARSSLLALAYSDDVPYCESCVLDVISNL